ncbi:MAG: AAA family ATPase, partial [Spirochaetaceae bacterium]|nr:AAA family ATPase [Spirochaetaceae bacterium]
MNHLKINNFKCFVDADINLNKLTVMAGANGNGKSTTIQALLYFRRTIEHCGEWIDDKYVLNKVNGMNVPLNGVYCLALGNSSFVLNRNSQDDKIILGLFDEEEELIVTYLVDNRDAKLYLTPTPPKKTQMVSFPVFKQEFYYLNAERIGPRVNQELKFFDYPNAGWQGETTAQLIGMESGYFKIDNERRFGDTQANYLIDQVNYWLDFVMKGVKVRVETSPNTLIAQILIENQFTASDPTLSTNLGFGISYILPIIATGLIAKKGSYFIVENPEAHLHPSAQSRIGRFLAMVANVGVHVIIETHSDHLLNGIQIAVAEKQINYTDVTVNFFTHEENSIQPIVNPIGM